MHPDAPASSTELMIFADYNSFDVRDPDAEEDLDTIDDTIDDLLRDFIASSTGVVTVGTFRRATVPVTVHTRTNPPDDDHPRGWDHVAEASLHLTSTDVMIRGGEDPRKAARVPLAPGTYRVRVHYTGLDTVTDGLNGNDHYHVTLWPGSETEPVVLKRYPGQRPGA